MGVLFIYSAASYTTGSQWKVQLFWLALGFAAYSLIALVDYKFWLENAHFFYILCIVLLLLVWSPLGDKRFGATRWLDLGPMMIQPSEPAKIGTLLMVASILARSEIKTFRESIGVLWKVGIVFFLPIVLIFLQPDLGSSLVFPPMVFAMLYVSNLSKRFFLISFVIFLGLMALVSWDIYGYNRYLKEHHITATENKGGYEKEALLPLKDYQRNRILSFVAPEVVDPQGIGVSWNLRQSLIAIGSGGFWGKGHNSGTQAKLGYLPQTVARNDFIFSVLAEESGFIGGFFVICLYAIMAINCIRIAGMARDRFGMLLSIGVGVILVVHVLVNVGMTIGIMPITGVPLPFVSYGGSFVLSCCVMQGFVQSVYRYRKDFV
jgi:rod shape determining protein RodA